MAGLGKVCKQDVGFYIEGEGADLLVRRADELGAYHGNHEHSLPAQAARAIESGPPLLYQGLRKQQDTG